MYKMCLNCCDMTLLMLVLTLSGIYMFVLDGERGDVETERSTGHNQRTAPSICNSTAQLKPRVLSLTPSVQHTHLVGYLVGQQQLAQRLLWPAAARLLTAGTLRHVAGI